jgi:hypothetical protein
MSPLEISFYESEIFSAGNTTYYKREDERLHIVFLSGNWGISPLCVRANNTKLSKNDVAVLQGGAESVRGSIGLSVAIAVAVVMFMLWSSRLSRIVLTADGGSESIRFHIVVQCEQVVVFYIDLFGEQPSIPKFSETCTDQMMFRTECLKRHAPLFLFILGDSTDKDIVTFDGHGHGRGL